MTFVLPMISEKLPDFRGFSGARPPMKTGVSKGERPHTSSSIQLPKQTTDRFETRFSGTTAPEAEGFPGTALGLTLSRVPAVDLGEITAFLGKIMKDVEGKSYLSDGWEERLKKAFTEIAETPLPGSAIYQIRDSQGVLVGMSCIQQDKNASHIAMLHSTALEPEYRGQGVGQWLMKHRIEFARQAGIKAIIMDATPGSRHIGEKNGFEPIGEGTSYMEGLTRMSRWLISDEERERFFQELMAKEKAKEAAHQK